MLVLIDKRLLSIIFMLKMLILSCLYYFCLRMRFVYGTKILNSLKHTYKFEFLFITFAIAENYRVLCNNDEWTMYVRTQVHLYLFSFSILLNLLSTLERSTYVVFNLSGIKFQQANAATLQFIDNRQNRLSACTILIPSVTLHTSNCAELGQVGGTSFGPVIRSTFFAETPNIAA